MPPDEGSLLWCLRGHGRDVRCISRRTASGLELRVLWGDELFLTETFRDPERLRKRSEEFKTTLEARGWTPMALEECRADQAAPGRPAPAVAARPGAGTAAARDNRRRASVLVVDDEPAIRTFLKTYLRNGGYDVFEAEDVDGALNALDRQPADAVVLDVRLPDPMGWGRTGLEVLAFIRLHAAFSRVPVLILTGHPLEPEERDLIERHRADLFLKPDGYPKLLQRLDELTNG